MNEELQPQSQMLFGYPPQVVQALVAAMDAAFQALAKDPTLPAAIAPGPQLLIQDRTLPGNRQGAAVLVKVARFSEALALKEPQTGGLLEAKQTLDAKKQRTGGLILP